jgi:protein-S-isoprenylcysteine O-methyltransferase Ste14
MRVIMWRSAIGTVGDRMTATAFIGICWIVFVAYWTVTARTVKPTAERQAAAGRALHLGVLVVAGLLLAGVWRPYPLDLRIIPHGAAADGGGIVICVLGLACAIWARRTLAGNWSASVNLKRGHELIQSGPYGYVRHPIYTGMLLMFFGSALVGGRLNPWLGFLVAVAGFWLKLRQEEALMMRHFPDAYPDYRRRVKAIVPFVL